MWSANRDLRVWLSSKLEESWSSTNINLNEELLEKLLENDQFSSLDTPIKLKVLFALLTSKRNVVVEHWDKVQRLLDLAQLDPVDWVKVTSGLLAPVNAGILAVEDLHHNPVFATVFEAIKTHLAHGQPLVFSTLESPYLSHTLLEPRASQNPQNKVTHFTLVKKTPRFTPASMPTKTGIQKIIQSQTRTSNPVVKSSVQKTTTVNSVTKPANSGTRSTTPGLPLLRKSTPIVNNSQQLTNIIKPNILKQPSLNPGRLTSTNIIDAVDTAEDRQKKIEKEERMREAGKNGETKKRPRNSSTNEQTNTKNVKRTMTPFIPTVVPEGGGVGVNLAPLLSKEPTDKIDPMQIDKSNMVFFVWQK